MLINGFVGIRIAPLLGFSCALIAASALWADEPAPSQTPPKMVMKSIRAEQAQTLADGLKACLVTMKVSGQQPQVVVRASDATSEPFLKWAELKEGDTIVSANGLPVRMRDDVVEAAAQLKTGAKLSLDVTRQGKPIVLRIRVGETGGDTPAAPQGKSNPSTSPDGKNATKQGDGAIVLNAEQMERELETLDPVTMMLLAAPRMVEDTNGAIVGITSDTMGNIPLASQVGLRSGDIIQSVNGMRITSEASIFEIVDRLQGQKRFEARILRNGKPVTLTVVAE
jgi:type II secretory pathway component PulC